MKRMNKKGQDIVGTFSALGAIAIAIVIGVMITAVVTNVVSGMNQSATANKDEEKVYAYGLTGFGTLAAKIPTLVTVAAAVLILGLVIGVGYYFMKGKE